MSDSLRGLRFALLACRRDPFDAIKFKVSDREYLRILPPSHQNLLVAGGEVLITRNLSSRLI